jgi:hypothetical protein
VKTTRISVSIIFVCALGLGLVHATSRGRHLKGTILAYDPIFHSVKQVSFVKNLEVTIADLGSSKGPQKLVKVVFEGFGEQQVSQDVLDGERPFQVRAVRDESCDEAHPRVASHLEQPVQGSGTFVLNPTHRSLSLGEVEYLACYRVEVPAAGH